MANNHNPKSPVVRYGLDNPQPLSRLKTELVWEGKYDEYGNRRAVDVPIGDEKETVAKDQSTLEMVAYRDMWGKGADEEHRKDTACVKVVNVFGCDTSITVDVNV